MKDGHQDHRTGAPVITFRDELGPGDPQAIGCIVSATGFFSASEVEIAVELARERLQKGIASGYEFVFAERGGRVCGYSCYGLIPCTLASYDLYWIAVLPKDQGGGLGRRLLAETERRIRAAGGTAAYAETSGRPQYAPTRAFYTRCGYNVGAVLPDFYAPGDGKVIFVKKLDSDASLPAPPR